MRISDWSSDVCSSDLVDLGHEIAEQVELGGDLGAADDGADRPRRGFQRAGEMLELALHQPPGGGGKQRSEESRVGKECVRTGRSRWSPHNSKQKADTNQ